LRKAGQKVDLKVGCWVDCSVARKVDYWAERKVGCLAD